MPTMAITTMATTTVVRIMERAVVRLTTLGRSTIIQIKTAAITTAIVVTIRIITKMVQMITEKMVIAIASETTIMVHIKIAAITTMDRIASTTTTPGEIMQIVAISQIRIIKTRMRVQIKIRMAIQAKIRIATRMPATAAITIITTPVDHTRARGRDRNMIRRTIMIYRANLKMHQRMCHQTGRTEGAMQKPIRWMQRMRRAEVIRKTRTGE